MTDSSPITAAQPKNAISGRWVLDPRRSSIEFRTPGMWGLVRVRGRFERFRGTMDLNASPAIELTIEASSVQTGNRRRDQHLRSADFFDAANHPLVKFRSQDTRLEGDRLTVRGRLSARGRSIPLDLTARVNEVEQALELEAAVSAPHRELGMTWNWMGAIRSHSRLRVKAHLLPDGRA